MSVLFKVCKRTIERGNYPVDMKDRIDAFYKAELINMEEHTILTGMLAK